MVNFGEWLPDQPDLNNPGATIARNCFPAETSYKSLRGLTVYSGAAAERVLSAFPAKDSDLNTYMFIGTTTYLYRLLTTTAWDNVSKAGDYDTVNESSWEFCQYGDVVIAVNGSDTIQSYTLGTSTDFADLVANIRGHHIAASADFVMIGNTWDNVDGSVPHRIRWCAYGDPTSWTISASTQSDYQDLNTTYGEVRKIIYNGPFVIFQDSAISRYQYVGSPLIFQLIDTETGKGTKIPGSVVNIGDKIFYLGEDGFYVYINGTSTPIGAGKVNKYFFSDLDTTYQDRIRAVIDPINQLVFWAYPTMGSAGVLDRQVIFNWATGRWSESRYSIECLGRAVSLGYTLEGLDSVSSSIDTLPFSLDSRAWKGGENSLVGFNTSHRMCYFTGDTLSTVVETPELQLTPGRRTHIRRIRPITDATCTAIVRTRNSQTDAITDSSAYLPVTDGSISTRENSRYARIQLTTTGDYDHIQGIEIEEAFPGGMR